MCYKPSDNLLEPSDSIAKAVSNTSDDGNFRSKFSRASGTTRSDLEFPEAAPLVFPDLDQIPDGDKPNAVKRSGKFLGEYFDRRAQARFVRVPTLFFFSRGLTQPLGTGTRQS